MDSGDDDEDEWSWLHGADMWISMDREDKRKFIRHLEVQCQHMEFRGLLALEANSVYGAMVAVPQIARCMDWNVTMFVLSMRSAFMLIVNYAIQFNAILFIAKESYIMEPFSGKVHLCDFASNLDRCPADSGCTGPGGGKFTAEGLNSFMLYDLRKHFRDTFQAVLQDSQWKEMAPTVPNFFHPGEYGLENYWCRVLACFIFMMAEVQDFFKLFDLSMVLLKTPNEAESWIYVDENEINVIKAPLESMKFRTAGMPVHWKLVNLVVVVIPKLYLLFTVCSEGFHFLMETAGIIDLVLGAMTMDFILQIDELVYRGLASKASKHIMQNLEGCLQEEPDPFTFKENEVTNGRRSRWGAIRLLLPTRLLFGICAFMFFYCRYYYKNCQKIDGQWVSKPMYNPISSKYTFWNMLSGSFPTQESPWWTMPEPGHDR